MISQIKIGRVRSTLSTTVPLAELSILVGPNGAGKSNLLRAVDIAGTTARSLRRLSRLDSMSVDLKWSGAEYLRGTAFIDMLREDEIYAYSSNPETTLRIEAIGLEERYRDFEEIQEPCEGELRLDFSPERDGPGLNVTARTRRGTVSGLLELISGTRFISAERLAYRPLRQRGYGNEHHDVLAGRRFIRAMQEVFEDTIQASKLDQLARNLFGIEFFVDPRSPDRMEFRDLRIGPRGVRLPFTALSLGTQQLFPILLHSLAMRPGAILLTEEPEVSLHPSAQVLIGEHLCNTARNGVQVIFTTHSHYLLLAVCKQVRDGVINPNQVSLLNCEKTRYGTKVRRLEMDESGRVEGWIPSFSQVDDRLFRDWVQSIPPSGNGARDK